MREQGRRRLLDLSPQLMQTSQFWPHEYRSDGYSRPVNGTRDRALSDLPIPPRKYWAYYCTSPESYLSSGQEDVQTMSRLLAEHGATLDNAGRILELGCAGGRMLRWLAHLAPETQLWGTDVWSSAILWCQDHLSPPMFFATNTVVPHLPFEDRSFGLVFCGSVFTHLDDLAETWFLELHRVLRPGGHLYFSVNDQHAVRVFEGEADPVNYPRYYERTGGQKPWDEYVEAFHARPDYERFRRGDAYMLTKGRSIDAQVLWNSDVLCQRLEHGYRKLAITPEAYGHQTTVLLERL
jgi:SAM-dependent methyltransferase